MHRYSRAIGFALLVFMGLFVLSGCLGRPLLKPHLPQLGTVRGSVVSEGTDAGVSGVYVYIPGTSAATFTNEDGVYILKDVPAGSHSVVIEYPQAQVQMMASAGPAVLDLKSTSPQLWQNGRLIAPSEIANTISTQQIAVPIVVQAGQESRLQGVSIPVFGSIDTVFLYHATPRLGSIVPVKSATNLAMIYLDVLYSLQNAPEGHVVALLTVTNQSGDEVAYRQESLYVRQGSDSAPLQFNLEGPLRMQFGLYLALLNYENEVLSMKYVGDYMVGGDAVPFAPGLEVVGYFNHHLYLRLVGGHSADFARYELNVGSQPTGCSSYPVYVSENPDLEVITHSTVPEGEEMYYRICLVTTSGEKIPGDPVSFYLPKYGVKTVTIHGGAADMVADPVRDLIYVAGPGHNQISVLSPVTDQIVGTIGVGINPNSLAITEDGEYLYVSHANTSYVAEVNLSTRQVERLIPVLRQARGVAVDSMARQLYATFYDRKAIAVSLDTLDIVWERDLDFHPSRSPILSPDRSLLIVNGLILSTTDGSVLGQIESRWNAPVFFGDHIYSDQYVYDVQTFTLVDELTQHVFGANPEEGLLYVFAGHTFRDPACWPYRTVYEVFVEPGTGAWYPTVRVSERYSGSGSRAALSPDGLYLYAPIDSYDYGANYLKIDLLSRRRGSPQ